MGTLKAIREVIFENNLQDIYIEQLKEDVDDKELMPYPSMPYGAAAKAVLTVVGVEDYHGYDEDTDYFIECFTNLRAEQKETTISQKPHN